MEQAIRKAIEGGYRHGTAPGDLVNVPVEQLSADGWRAIMEYFFYGDAYNSPRWITQQVLLDPLFWQGLGKALGWGKTKMTSDEKTYKSSLLSVWPEEWQVYWHCFIDHIVSGKSPDDFFNELLK